MRDFVVANADRYVGWLTEACSIQSLAEHPDGLVEMAAWVEDKMSSVGLGVSRLQLPSMPDALLGEAGNGERSVLIYDHYDVQPVDPIELWDTKPFEPEIRDGKFYARGAADNKGDLVARLAALDVFRETRGDLPVVLKFLVEGEEEIGSTSFPALVARYGDRFRADGCIWEGAGIDHAGRPELVFGAKGMAYVELWSRSLADDQHSSVAVIAPSAAWRLVAALSTLYDGDGRVLIEGFYDDVEQPNALDEELLAALPFEEDAERERLGVDRFVAGVSGVELLRRYFFEPTCNIAGIYSGFTVPGASKTVLPKEAMAKLDLRLVPKQDPEQVVGLIREHLDERGFSDIEVVPLGHSMPVRSPADSFVGKAALEATKVFDQPAAVSPLMIGTGPMYPIAGTLGIPTVSPACTCRPDSNIHAPNEQIRVDDYLKIIEYTVAYLDALSG